MPYDMVTPFPPTDVVSVRTLLNFVYLHVVEPCVQGLLDHVVDWESNDFLRAFWAGKLWIAARGFARDSTIKQADEQGELIAFGRHFTSNVRSPPAFLLCLIDSHPHDSPIFLSGFTRTFH
jgi:hypothetical protein